MNENDPQDDLKDAAMLLVIGLVGFLAFVGVVVWFVWRMV